MPVGFGNLGSYLRARGWNLPVWRPRPGRFVNCAFSALIYEAGLESPGLAPQTGRFQPDFAICPISRFAGSNLGRNRHCPLPLHHSKRMLFLNPQNRRSESANLEIAVRSLGRPRPGRFVNCAFSALIYEVGLESPGLAPQTGKIPARRSWIRAEIAQLAKPAFPCHDSPRYTFVLLHMLIRAPSLHTFSAFWL